MREWRKLYKGIRESDRLRRLGFEARWLYILLLSAQDDAGCYPWTEAKIRLLTAATTKWTVKQCESHASRLRTQGLITIEDGMVEIVGGADKNGIPHNVRGRALLYEKPEPRVACESRATSPRARGEERRVEKTPPPAPLGRARKDSPYAWANILREIPTYKATPEQETQTQARFEKAGFPEDRILSTARAMLASKAQSKYARHDQALYNWVERDMRDDSGSPTARRQPSEALTFRKGDGLSQLLEERKREADRLSEL